MPTCKTCAECEWCYSVDDWDYNSQYDCLKSNPMSGLDQRAEDCPDFSDISGY